MKQNDTSFQPLTFWPDQSDHHPHSPDPQSPKVTEGDCILLHLVFKENFTAWISASKCSLMEKGHFTQYLCLRFLGQREYNRKQRETLARFGEVDSMTNLGPSKGTTGAGDQEEPRESFAINISYLTNLFLFIIKVWKALVTAEILFLKPPTWNVTHSHDWSLIKVKSTSSSPLCFPTHVENISSITSTFRPGSDPGCPINGLSRWMMSCGHPFFSRLLCCPWILTIFISPRYTAHTVG